MDIWMFFGFLGLIHSLFCIPILAILHFSNFEIFKPLTIEVSLYLSVNGLLGTVLSNVLWAKAIILTSPLIVNIGTSMSIPLSFFADYINPNSTPPPMRVEYLIGSGLVVSSFLLASIVDQNETSARTPVPRISLGLAAECLEEEDEDEDGV
eukprot:CAMPEP_0184305278 /NCGR_PEP_ID=MMETSP1049-20130417/14593_1 /TAXON_ID=77928 /ORGANISM="Proteomonas sulcata, Strain CCMP704" /LENGTH=151 /DNA_ID=CAMNT_0026617307 /DNA_START=381 /DNA_END=836 /DNA_ORIENTATION=+